MPPNDSFTRRIFSATVSGSPTSSAPVGPSCASKCARVIGGHPRSLDRKSTRLNSSHSQISYAVFCLKKKIHKHHKQLLRNHNPWILMNISQGHQPITLPLRK